MIPGEPCCLFGMPEAWVSGNQNSGFYSLCNHSWATSQQKLDIAQMVVLPKVILIDHWIRFPFLTKVEPFLFFSVVTSAAFIHLTTYIWSIGWWDSCMLSDESHSLLWMPEAWVSANQNSGFPASVITTGLPANWCLIDYHLVYSQ